jgi:hypothetical protein
MKAVENDYPKIDKGYAQVEPDRRAKKLSILID